MTDVSSRSLAQYPRVRDWLAPGPDATILVRTGKVEVGQRIGPALRRIAATELGLPLRAVMVLEPCTDTSPDEGFTASSRSIEDSGMAIAFAAATLRERAARRSDLVSGAPEDAGAVVALYHRLLAEDPAVDPEAGLVFLGGVADAPCAPDHGPDEPVFGGRFITDIAVPDAAARGADLPARPSARCRPTRPLIALAGLRPALDLFREGAFVVVYAGTAAGARAERRRAEAVLRWSAGLAHVTSGAVHRRQHAEARAAPAEPASEGCVRPRRRCDPTPGPTSRTPPSRPPAPSRCSGTDASTSPPTRRGCIR